MPSAARLLALAPALVLLAATCCARHGAHALPVGATKEQTQRAYAQAGERFNELRERFTPVGKTLMNSKLPEMLTRTTSQMQESTLPPTHSFRNNK